MKPFQFFRVGKHTSAGGTTLEFTEEHVRAAVAAYDPAVHEAPIVVGHPKDNHPAYGWVKSLSFGEGHAIAEPIQVDEAFAELVTKGRFKKRSASWYTPDAPNNPKPGAYYLRHIGFLGAQPPSVKGLKDVHFADNEEGVIEFADDSTLAALFRGLRDWIVDKFDLETADRVLPGFYINDLERSSAEQSAARSAAASFSEEDDMDLKKQLEDALAAKTAADKVAADATKAATDVKAAMDAQSAEFTESKKKLDEISKRERDAARAGLSAEVETLVKDGRVLPAQKDKIVEFLESLDADKEVVEFGEGDELKKFSPRAFVMHLLGETEPMVDFGERSHDGQEEYAEMQTVKERAEQIKKIQADATARGETITATQAAHMVAKRKAA